MEICEVNSNFKIELLDEIVKLHIKAFPDFFLTQLGDGFLKTLYLGYLEDKSSGIIVAKEENHLIGFIAYSRDYSNFYKGLIKHHLIKFAFCSLCAAVKHPSFTKRLLGAFKKSDEVVKNEAYVELASIAVNPDAKGKGTGTLLIDYLKKAIDFNKFSYISLETDADNNKSVNEFYKKNGFELAREYTTAEGRRMNEYHYSEQ